MKELAIEIEYELESIDVKTAADLDLLFEGNLRVKDATVVFAVNKGETGRNEDKAPYYKVYIGTTSTGKIDRKTEMYRIMFLKPEYTDHTGAGYTPKEFSGKAKRIIKKALMTEVISKDDEHQGKKIYGWEELNLMGSTEFNANYLRDRVRERPIQREDESDNDFKLREKKELREIKSDVEKEVDYMLDNMKYDGKR